MSIDPSSTQSEFVCATKTHYQVISKEQCGPNLYYPSPGMVEEVNSGFALSNSNLSSNKASISYNQSPWPEFSTSLRKLERQLSLENANDENDAHYFAQNLPSLSYNQSPWPEFSISLHKLERQLSLENANDENGAHYFAQNLPTFSDENNSSQDFDFLDNRNVELTQESQGYHSSGDGFRENQNGHKSANNGITQPSWNHKKSAFSAPVTVIESSYANQTTYLASDLLLDQDILTGDDSSLSVAGNKMFSIREIYPEWAFSSETTKVFIFGDFLCNSSDHSWAIMFGEIVLPANIIQEGVLCCIAPQHTVGKVSLYVTCQNRAPCSELKIFEHRAKPTNSIYSYELLMQIKRGCLLLGHSSEGCSLEWIMQELLEEKIQQWLLSKSEGNDLMLSKQEQGIIHIISSLGYEWALNPILNYGVGVNFRDPKGWTALHWAARFGRENMVATLLAAGASPEAVTDATQNDPVGKTAGAIAAAYGYIGLAGYLSEANLTSHLFQLTIAVSENPNNLTELESQGGVESISERSNQMHAGGTEDELSLKDSLAAVRNATQALARIQAVFRARSFKRRQMMNAAQDESDIYVVSGLSKLKNVGHGKHAQNMDKAALSIQKKYRGWKRQKDFLNLRKNAMKIQAHFRGYQERKKYNSNTIIWAVSMLDKAVLRWHRRSAGLRGYKAETETELNADTDENIYEIVKHFRKLKVDAAHDQAVRVIQMVNSPTARLQYRRMLERFQQTQVEATTADEGTSNLMNDFIG